MLEGLEIGWRRKRQPAHDTRGRPGVVLLGLATVQVEVGFAGRGTLEKRHSWKYSTVAEYEVSTDSVLGTYMYSYVVRGGGLKHAEIAATEPRRKLLRGVPGTSPYTNGTRR